MLYPWQHDQHLADYLKAKHNLTVQWMDDAPVADSRFMCFKGDYDLDIKTASGPTVWGAAIDYTSCYDGDLFDKLVELETGEKV